MDADTAVIGAIRANEEPRYEGRRPAVIRKNSKVPIAVKKALLTGENLSTTEQGTWHQTLRPRAARRYQSYEAKTAARREGRRRQD